jgi:hypothetical protein
VKNETTLMVSDAYPNPTTSDVYFKIVVSGSAPPHHLEFLVFGVNGQVQAILTEADFPTLHIGNNELVWNASSQNGNPMPNGMYIYKLTVGAADKVVQRLGKLAVMK